MKILKLKNTETEMKNLLEIFKSRSELTEEINNQQTWRQAVKIMQFKEQK